MKTTIPIYVGYDIREAVCYHTFSQSVIEHSGSPVAFHPLAKGCLNGFDGQRDGSNAFIYSRFLVPSLQQFQGWAIFVDGDMVCLEDIANLWALRNEQHAVMVVKHDYKTLHHRKYIGTPLETVNADYPRKNWSSVILWNCGHPSNRILTPEFIGQSPGSLLHRFQWLKDDEIGELPAEWNALSEEQDISGASLIHYTLGNPGISHYDGCDGAPHWHRSYRAMLESGE
jgi:lipopolysaccharide biosynthesis glycosyltransferase